MTYSIHLPEITMEESDGTTATFVIEPLHTGFGITLGNSLRRVLLSALSGAAITAFKIEEANHEFSTIEGVKEDLIEIMLNLKQVRFRVYSDQPQTLRISKKGKGVITASDIETNADVEVVNIDQHVATLDNKQAKLDIELRVEKGRGYVTADERKNDESEVGYIGIDSLFSPIKRVRYKVEHTRVGQITNLDKLLVEVTTDGTITPEDAVKQAGAILVEQFNVIAGGEAVSELTPAETETDTVDPDQEPNELDFSVEDLSLSPRTTNALVNNEIKSVRELLNMSDNELKNLKGFGAKAYQEVTQKLKELELR